MEQLNDEIRELEKKRDTVKQFEYQTFININQSIMLSVGIRWCSRATREESR